MSWPPKPSFLSTNPPELVEQEDMPLGDYYMEYQSMEEGFQDVLSFKDLCLLKNGNKGNGTRGVPA